MSYSDRVELYALLRNLSDTDAKAILAILQEQKEDYSENRNGVFFDLEQVSDRTIKHLQELQNQRHPIS